MPDIDIDPFMGATKEYPNDFAATPAPSFKRTERELYEMATMREGWLTKKN